MWSWIASAVNISVPYSKAHSICTVASTCQARPTHEACAWGMMQIHYHTVCRCTVIVIQQEAWSTTVFGLCCHTASIKYIITLFVNVCLCSHDVAGWESKFKRSEVSCSVRTRAHKMRIEGKASAATQNRSTKRELKCSHCCPLKSFTVLLTWQAVNVAKCTVACKGVLGLSHHENYHKWTVWKLCWAGVLGGVIS